MASGQEFRRTLDAGKTWETLTNAPPCRDVRQIRCHPTNPATAFCQSYGTYYRTDDYGEHWTPIIPAGASGLHHFAVHPLRPDTLFMADHRWIWRSDDGGKTWRVIFTDESKPLVHAMFDPEDADTYYFIHPRMVRTTADDGETWTEKPFKNHLITDDVYVAYSGNPVAVERTREATYVFTPGEEPRKLSIGRPCNRIDAMAIHPRNGHRLAAMTSEGPYISTDAGKTWEKTGSRDLNKPLEFILFDPTEENVLFRWKPYNGRVTACNIETGEQRVLCDIPSPTYFTCLDISTDGKTFWAGTMGSSVWILKTEQGEATPTLQQ